MDNKYIYSGSDEMNIRLWKANASEKLGALRPRERAKLEYSEALKEKFAAHPQVKRIAKHRHVPKGVLNATKKVSGHISTCLLVLLLLLLFLHRESKRFVVCFSENLICNLYCVFISF